MASSVDAICDVSSMSVSNWSHVRKCVNCMYFAHAQIFQTLSIDLPFMHGDTDIANFADDNTPYTSAKNINDVTESLEQASLPPFKWF